MPPPAKPSPELLPFEGFAPDALDFFIELDAHQTRDWFLENKQRYDVMIHQPLSALVASLSLAFAVHDIPLLGDAKASLFRINRDVRFSHDKHPYKTNASAVLTRDGTKRSQGVVYMQFGPDECFAAAGFYALEPDQLDAFRRHILAKPDQWSCVEAALAADNLALSRDNMAVRLPRGFDAATIGERGETIRLKSFIVRMPLTRQQTGTSDLVDDIVAMTRAVIPLLEFGWAALRK